MPGPGVPGRSAPGVGRGHGLVGLRAVAGAEVSAEVPSGAARR